MVGVLGPLVQGTRQLRGSVKSVLGFALGAVAGAAVTGALIGLLGAGLQELAGDAVLAVVVGAAGCVLVLADLGVFGWRTPTLRRQTSSTWYREHGARSVWVFWGFDLGLGFSTIRLSSLYWLMALFVASFVSPVLAPVALAFYGLGLAVAFAAAIVVHARGRPSADTTPGLALLHAARRARLASVALLGTLSIAIVAWGGPW